MLDVERWAELRREHFVRGVGVRELARRFGISRNTVRAALRSEEPPAFRFAAGESGPCLPVGPGRQGCLSHDRRINYLPKRCSRWQADERLRP